MKDGKAVRKGMKMKLSTALLLNANLPAGTNQIPVEYFLLSQNKEIK
jgi:antitoxin component of RelBE/YafQ-DinJ toxin-antitoxin module